MSWSTYIGRRVVGTEGNGRQMKRVGSGIEEGERKSKVKCCDKCKMREREVGSWMEEES